MDKNITVAIGIDEAGINDDNDILQEMRLAQKIHREPGSSARYTTSHQIFDLTTVNGSKVTFFEDRIGTLEAGKRADIVLVNMDRIEALMHKVERAANPPQIRRRASLYRTHPNSGARAGRVTPCRPNATATTANWLSRYMARRT